MRTKVLQSILVLMGSILAGCVAIAAGQSDMNSGQADRGSPANDGPFLVVLGVAQDGGVPQAGTKHHPGWSDPASKRMAVCVAIVEPATKQRWLIDATPDFREQLHRLDIMFPVTEKPGLAGIFLTHAHMGHYTGLMHLGFEVMGTHQVPVYAMPRMADYLQTNGPWSQLVKYENIVLEPLQAGQAMNLNEDLKVTPFLVPHRQEYSEVVGFRIDGPRRSVLYLPDIDKWEDWDEQGTRIEDVLVDIDVAYLDGTFFADGEILGRDMSTFPHPFIRDSMDRFSSLPDSVRARVRFLHFNHTNPALIDSSQACREIQRRGFRVAVELERVGL